MLNPQCRVVILMEHLLILTNHGAADTWETFTNVHPQVCTKCQEYRVPTVDRR